MAILHYLHFASLRNFNNYSVSYVKNVKNFAINQSILFLLPRIVCILNVKTVMMRTMIKVFFFFSSWWIMFYFVALVSSVITSPDKNLSLDWHDLDRLMNERMCNDNIMEFCSRYSSCYICFCRLNFSVILIIFLGSLIQERLKFGIHNSSTFFPVVHNLSLLEINIWITWNLNSLIMTSICFLLIGLLHHYYYTLQYYHTILYYTIQSI